MKYSFFILLMILFLLVPTPGYSVDVAELIAVYEEKYQADKSADNTYFLAVALTGSDRIDDKKRALALFKKAKELGNAKAKEVYPAYKQSVDSLSNSDNTSTNKASIASPKPQDIAPTPRNNIKPDPAISGNYVVKNGDTAGELAKRYLAGQGNHSPSFAELNGAINSMISVNPGAFLNGDRNRLIAGRRLNLEGVSNESRTPQESPPTNEDLTFRVASSAESDATTKQNEDVKESGQIGGDDELTRLRAKEMALSRQLAESVAVNMELRTRLATLEAGLALLKSSLEAVLDERDDYKARLLALGDPVSDDESITSEEVRNIIREVVEK